METLLSRTFFSNVPGRARLTAIDGHHLIIIIHIYILIIFRILIVLIRQEVFDE